MKDRLVERFDVAEQGKTPVSRDSDGGDDDSQSGARHARTRHVGARDARLADPERCRVARRPPRTSHVRADVARCGVPDETEDAIRAARASEASLIDAGERGLGEYRCVTCGYGIVTLSVLPMCPMCHGSAWTLMRASPFTAREGNR
jgi:hypothetical protein